MENTNSNSIPIEEDIELSSQVYAIIKEILKERDHQNKKHGESFKNSHPHSSSEYKLKEHSNMTTLTEELGEAAMALNDADYDELTRELIQVAACVFAWLENKELDISFRS
jgi:hypothetical protein